MRRRRRRLGLIRRLVVMHHFLGFRGGIGRSRRGTLRRGRGGRRGRRRAGRGSGRAAAAGHRDGDRNRAQHQFFHKSRSFSLPGLGLQGTRHVGTLVVPVGVPPNVDPTGRPLRYPPFMEGSGTSSVPRDADDNGAGGEALAGAGGAAAPAALTAEPPPAEGPASTPAKGGNRFVPSSRSGLILTVCCIAQFMVILDLSIVNVALPSIQSSLNFTSADLQWVVDAYAITFAGFLLLGGRGARPARERRVFGPALLLFSITSLVGGAAVNRQMLLVARGVQGFSCAFMAASSLAIITSSFPPGPKLHRAIALWAAMNGLGGAAGTLFGGVINQLPTWRWILFINPPIAVATALIAWRVVKDRTRETQGFDLPGALTLTIGQLVLVYGVVRAGIVGWLTAEALIPIIVGLGLLMSFNVIELKWARAPLIPFKQLTRQLNVA